MANTVRQAPRTPRQIVHGEWKEMPSSPNQRALLAAGIVMPTAKFYQLGNLAVILTREWGEGGWHLSISHPSRYPSWDEIAHARYHLLPAELTFVMFLPPEWQYVNIEGGPRAGNVFHLHEFHDAESDRPNEAQS